MNYVKLYEDWLDDELDSESNAQLTRADKNILVHLGLMEPWISIGGSQLVDTDDQVFIDWIGKGDVKISELVAYCSKSQWNLVAHLSNNSRLILDNAADGSRKGAYLLDTVDYSGDTLPVPKSFFENPEEPAETTIFRILDWCAETSYKSDSQ
jgi:hypothetical protein